MRLDGRGARGLLPEVPPGDGGGVRLAQGVVFNSGRNDNDMAGSLQAVALLNRIEGTTLAPLWPDLVQMPGAIEVESNAHDGEQERSRDHGFAGQRSMCDRVPHSMGRNTTIITGLTRPRCTPRAPTACPDRVPRPRDFFPGRGQHAARGRGIARPYSAAHTDSSIREYSPEA